MIIFLTDQNDSEELNGIIDFFQIQRIETTIKQARTMKREWQLLHFKMMEWKDDMTNFDASCMEYG